MALAPAPPLIPGTHRLVQVALLGKMHEQLTVNTFHFLVNTTTPATLALADTATKWWAGVRSQWTNAVSVEWRAELMVARVIGHPDIMPQNVVTAAPNVGTHEVDALPGVCAAIIKKISTFGGKRGRGRVYIAGTPEDGAEEGIIDEDQRVLYQNLADRFVVDFGWSDTGTATPYLWSRNVGLEAGVRGVPYTNAQADTILGTQRRRRIGRGV